MINPKISEDFENSLRVLTSDQRKVEIAIQTDENPGSEDSRYQLRGTTSR